MCKLFVEDFNLDIKGTTTAATLTMVMNLTLLTLYAHYDSDLKDVYSWPNKHSLHGLSSYFKSAIPATVLFTLEWWTYDIITLFTLLISVEATGACIIVLNVLYSCYCFTAGLQLAG